MLRLVDSAAQKRFVDHYTDVRCRCAAVVRAMNVQRKKTWTKPVVENSQDKSLQEPLIP